MGIIAKPGKGQAVHALTPYDRYEGYQDDVNRLYISGWAWDRQCPDTAITLEVYDGNRLLGTVVADRYRSDLRQLGLGDGCHGYVFAMPKSIRSLSPHVITTHIAGTAITLRDSRTDELPRPVSRRDTPRVAPIPYFSLSPLLRWWYYTVLKTLLCQFPQPVWRVPAALLAAIMVVGDARGRRLDAALLAALQMPRGRLARWRLNCQRCYLHQVQLVLSLQTERFTVPWIMKHVRMRGAPPAGGAILVTPHHYGQLLTSPFLSHVLESCGAISAERPERDDVMIDPTLRLHWRQMRHSRARVFKGQVLSRHNAARRGLRLLQEGGYLIVCADDPTVGGDAMPLLGRAMTIPRGAVWFAQRSSKPIVPMMLVPDACGWAVWFGDPVPSTQAGVVMALTRCIRRSPASWMGLVAKVWLDAPPWPSAPRGVDATSPVSADRDAV